MMFLGIPETQYSFDGGKTWANYGACISPGSRMRIVKDGKVLYTAHAEEKVQQCTTCEGAGQEKKLEYVQDGGSRLEACEVITGRMELEQEYGQDHPWAQFDLWHEDFHKCVDIAWPCKKPLRCFWRWTRKTGVALNQSGVIGT
jgi:hypothetical protein